MPTPATQRKRTAQVTKGYFADTHWHYPSLLLPSALLHGTPEGWIPLALVGSADGFCDGYAEGSEAIQDSDADPELGNLTIEVSGHEFPAECLHAVHL